MGIVSATPLAQYAGASEEIIRYVARTREPVILRDATKEAPLAGSAYVMRTAPRSVLAIPVVHQGSLLAVLYLENALTTGAFTESRVDFLRTMSAQAAISLQCATVRVAQVAE